MMAGEVWYVQRYREALAELEEASPALAQMARERLACYPDPARRLWLAKRLLAWQRRECE